MRLALCANHSWVECPSFPEGAPSGDLSPMLAPPGLGVLTVPRAGPPGLGALSPVGSCPGPGHSENVQGQRNGWYKNLMAFSAKKNV